jgi:hypothetical protein
MSGGARRETVLGPIVALQIQRTPAKVKGIGYLPDTIVTVDEAVVGPQGMLGLCDGSWVVDVHHSAHPAARGGGNRALSIGFSGHYTRMDRQYGGVPLGIAGENLVVQNESRIHLKNLRGSLVIAGPDGEVVLGGARVAAPCPEFTSFLLGRDDVAERGEIAEDLEFLEHGMRGFILDTSGLERPLRVRLGDLVTLRP